MRRCKCIVCGQRGAERPRSICTVCWRAMHSPETLAAMETRKQARLASIKEMRKTMTDGQMADRILREHMDQT